MTGRAASVLALLAVSAACRPLAVPRETAPDAPRRAAPSDTASALIPAGMGTLRQEDVALRMTQFGLQVRAVPLDESVIRVLSPDSYRTLHELVVSQRPRLTEIARRNALSSVSVWYISFFGVEQGETRFSPMEVILSNVGQNFRPLDVIPLSPGFGLQRLRQREVQHGLYVFDGRVDVNQPLTISYETVSNGDWATILQRIERERALVRSRAKRS